MRRLFRSVYFWIGLIGILGFAALIPFWAVLLIPRTYFFDYASVQNTKAIVGEPLLFKSTRSVKISMPTDWTDILYCKSPDGQYVRIYSSETRGKPKVTDGYQTTIEWVYGEKNGYIPKRESTCRLESLIIGRTSLGITKEQYLVGEEFKITTQENKPSY